MNTQTNIDPQQSQPKGSTVAIKGADQAKKEPPKFIEKVIEKVEEVLTSPAAKSIPEEKKEEKLLPQQKTYQQEEPVTPEQAQTQGSLGGSSEYELPKGTTITLPDGNAFETQTESKITKKGGE
jgi:hypothetical protein